MADLHAAPKALLHEHLDGGLRPETLFELCTARGIELPARVRYLQTFAINCAAMASSAACERIWYEAAEDARHDGCVPAELRMAPLRL
jgi:adenosine deaminase